MKKKLDVVKPAKRSCVPQSATRDRGYVFGQYIIHPHLTSSIEVLAL